MANAYDSIWTEELVSRFIKLHSDGLSFVAIGEALGLTKSACIGKAGRLKLPARRKSADRPRQERKPREPNVKAVNKPKLRIVRAGYGNGMRLDLSVTTDLPIFTCVDEGSLNKTLSELGPNECKYIAGDPREAALYCGHPIYKRSYCVEHFARCYVDPVNRPAAPASPGYQGQAPTERNQLGLVA
jgi:hypothetical protein